MNILVLCQQDNHRKLLPAYVSALRVKGARMSFVDPTVALDTPLSEIVARCEQRPDWILHFESDLPLLPDGLAESEIPTVHFDVDTYTYTHRRMRWASLFDHVSVCHPGYDEIFRRGGHPGAFVLAHAVRREFFARAEQRREFEVGWIGQVNGSIYRRRAQWLPKLASKFRMNEWTKSNTLEEVAQTYLRSRVVVNFGRDDFPQDANMRVFEVLASGALLVTSLPSELTLLGFREGQHFVGYTEETEIIPLVSRFLKDEPARARIAEMGREKCLSEHTYDARVEQLLGHLQKLSGQKLAPARRWPKPRVELMYLDFYVAHGLTGCAWKKFSGLAGRGFSETIHGAALLGRAFVKELHFPRRTGG